MLSIDNIKENTMSDSLHMEIVEQNCLAVVLYLPRPRNSLSLKDQGAEKVKLITGAIIAEEVAGKEGLEGWKVGKVNGEVIAGENW